MNVRLGWSADVNGTWTKMDVEVDESDLLSHFHEMGVNPETATFSPLEKFKLMYSLAETFVLLHKMSRYPTIYDNADSRKELSDLIAMQKKLTNTIAERE